MSDLKQPSRAQRKQALIALCSEQRTQMGREIEFMRAPSKLTGGGIGRYFPGGVKGPLALAAMVAGVVAARSAKTAPLLATGMSVYKLVQTGLTMLRQRAS